MSRPGGPPKAAVFGCSGTTISDEENRFFAETNPLGFILFKRNVETPDQVRALVSELRATVEDETAPVLIDQEGGRVQRLGPPHWADRPTAGCFADMARSDPDGAAAALTDNAIAIAYDLADLGITVDCWPVADLPQDDADPIIGDRALGTDVETITRLGRVIMDALGRAGVSPVIKHLPGHGRAQVDSHKELPLVETDLDTLRATDFLPFRGLRDAPWGMTAHVVYSAIDPDVCATFSEKVIGGIIRGEIGFDGFLVSDDLSMGALSGDFAERTARALAAGCDAVLHCNGEMAEMSAVAGVLPQLTDIALDRFQRAEAARLAGPGGVQ